MTPNFPKHPRSPRPKHDWSLGPVGTFIEDAFPNSEERFRDAFAQPHPAPELLKLLKEHPTYATVIDLMVFYTFVAEEDPNRADVLASALVAVRDSPEAPKIDDLSIFKLFRRELHAFHSRGLDINDNTKALSPTNTFLIASLLSGLSFKYDLTSCSDQLGSIVDGLEVCDNSSSAEVLVGACIQLLTGGSQIVSSFNSYIQSPNQVPTKLHAQKTAGTVQNANALKLLELAVLHAETGLQKENEAENVWQILFPSQA